MRCCVQAVSTFTTIIHQLLAGVGFRFQVCNDGGQESTWPTLRLDMCSTRQLLAGGRGSGGGARNCQQWRQQRGPQPAAGATAGSMASWAGRLGAAAAGTADDTGAWGRGCSSRAGSQHQACSSRGAAASRAGLHAHAGNGGCEVCLASLDGAWPGWIGGDIQRIDWQNARVSGATCRRDGGVVWGPPIIARAAGQAAHACTGVHCRRGYQGMEWGWRCSNTRR